MARLHRALALICTVAAPAALPLALGGCVELVVVGGIAAAAGGGYAVGQERGADGMANDFTIKTEIAKALTQTDPQLQAAITTSVYNGRVVLTGRVPSPAMKAAAAQIAGRTHQVRTVYDEVEVAPVEGIWDDAKDTWITTQVRSEMVVDPSIRSVNYAIETENGSVYLIGSARSQGELDRATRIARHVPGVKRVVSYVEVRSGAPVVAGPPALGASPPPAAYPGPSYPSPGYPRPASPSPIEVQKL